MKLCISCAPGWGSVLAKECKKLGYEPFDTFEQGTYINTTTLGIAHLNHHLRTAHKVYIVAFQGYIDDFDTLFSIAYNYEWEKIRNRETDSIRVTAHSHSSRLHSTRTIQSIIQKAVYKKLGSDGSHISPIGKKTQEIHYRTYRNTGLLLINTSGISLHQRGYRTQTGEAPIKESLAMSMLLQTGWSHQHILRDPCCGSGTIPIEAALYASNRLPGAKRKFAYQTRTNHQFYEKEQKRTEKVFAHSYYILGSDKNPDMIHLAQENAKRAGVEHLIHRECHDIATDQIIPTTIRKRQKDLKEKYEKKEIPWHLCTNPPYGKRLQSTDIDKIYYRLIEYGESGQCKGGYICPIKLPEPRHYANNAFSYKKKNIRNGQEPCSLYYRQNKTIKK